MIQNMKLLFINRREWQLKDKFSWQNRSYNHTTLILIALSIYQNTLLILTLSWIHTQMPKWKDRWNVTATIYQFANHIPYSQVKKFFFICLYVSPALIILTLCLISWRVKSRNPFSFVSICNRPYSIPSNLNSTSHWYWEKVRDLSSQTMLNKNFRIIYYHERHTTNKSFISSSSDFEN